MSCTVRALYDTENQVTFNRLADTSYLSTNVLRLTPVMQHPKSHALNIVSLDNVVRNLSNIDNTLTNR